MGWVPGRSLQEGITEREQGCTFHPISKDWCLSPGKQNQPKMGEGGETQRAQPEMLKFSNHQTLTQPRQLKEGMSSSILAWETPGASPHMA